jgi:hypothetical protein
LRVWLLQHESRQQSDAMIAIKTESAWRGTAGCRCK